MKKYILHILGFYIAYNLLFISIDLISGSSIKWLMNQIIAIPFSIAFGILILKSR